MRGDPIEVAMADRPALVSDRWLIRLFVIAMVVFAVSMAAAIMVAGTRGHRPSAVERGQNARIAVVLPRVLS